MDHKGIRVQSEEHSLTVSRDGPIAQNDHYLLWQMANFIRERIPSRTPKAVAHWEYFEKTQHVRKYTKAKVFSLELRLTF
jgi:catalase